MPTTTEALVVESGGASARAVEVELDDPRPDEVLVRTVAVGLCHTDLTVASGALPFPLPGVLGHEGAGIVEAVGSAVRGVSVGDEVLTSFTSCGDCRNCRQGHPAYCVQWLPLNLLGGRRADGSPTITRAGEPLGGHFFGQSSFARHALVDERSLVRVPAGSPLPTLAPLGCGFQTGAGAVWNALRPRPGDAVVVLGAGAVGLAAVAAAALTPATRIVAVDRVAHRLETARRFGATHVVDTSALDGDLTAVLLDVTGGGADGVVDTTGVPALLRAGVDALAPRGTALAVGAPPFGVEVGVDVNGLLPGRRVEGITLGDGDGATLIPALVDLVADGRMPLGELVRTYSFDRFDEAVADMHSGATVKPVLVP
ncbi:NAD(P)-dependent alcohol dehydrogenase [Kineococcus endophyticus]|uniref:NAD(P)-dependent alcohol dehydrogenase n=1 Tax=Kineococcus endophyticus TaxID=1181883 RepID=A0ABV3P447_9ACTN